MTDGTGIWRIAAGAFGLSGIVAGAVAAHALPDPQAASVGQASLYQLIHAAGLLGIAPYAGRAALVAKLGFTLGTGLFSGSVILANLSGFPRLGAFAPFGGLCLMAGWAAILLGGFLRPGHRP